MGIVLVTGANGFVGSALCNQMRKKDIVFRQTLRRQPTITQIESSVVVGDINDKTDWSQALKNVTHVVHLAARVHVLKDDSAEPLAEFVRINVEGTLNLARQAVNAGVRRFIFLSTIKVNGEETFDKPFTSDDKPAPMDPYAISKFRAEKGLGEIARQTGLELVIIRPPLVYGKGVAGNFKRLIQLVRNDFPLPLGAVCNKRSLVYLENLCDLIMVCLCHPKAAGQTLLIADGQDISTPDLLRLLAQVQGKTLRLISVPVNVLKLLGRISGHSKDVRKLLNNLQVDCSSTQAILDWHPSFSLEQGIRRTVT